MIKTGFKSALFLAIVLVTTTYAKPVNNQMALSDLKKPFSVQAMSSRPLRDFQYLTPGGHFIIHYDNSGYNAVPQDYAYNDSIPDFVFKAAEYLDDSYSMLHDSLGYDSPPADDIETPEIDIYFRYDLSYYGVTYPETNLGNDEYTAYLTLSTQLNDSTVFYTYGLEGLRVTCAHELFHIFQLGYRYRYEDVFYFEMSSVWFEEYMYPEVNDYHSYFRDYARNWNYKLDNDALDYNNAGFNFYIDKRFSVSGDNIIHDIWNRILTVNAMTAIRNELNSRGTDFENALSGWGCAQVLCGPYSSEGFSYPFNDAPELDTISFALNSDQILSTTSANITLSVYPTTTYYKLSGIPRSVLLFESIFDDGVSAKLVCLNGDQSEIRTTSSGPIVVDGTKFNEYILVIGADVSDASGSFAFTSITKDQFAMLYPNPLSSQSTFNLTYVLLNDEANGRLSIYNIRGQRVYSELLADAFTTAGLHELGFIPPALSSGVYVVALHFNDSVIAEKFTYLK